MTKTAAVIGCGRMGQRHIEAVLGMRDQLKLIGITDARIEAMQDVAKNLNIAHTCLFSDFSSLLQKQMPDLVIISTTASSHHAYTLHAAKAGVKYILCEKPMAVSVQQCEEMITACKQSSTHLAINHPVRFTEADIEIKKLMSSDAMGGLNAINVSAGNFGLAMNASHNLEMFRFMTDELPSSVQAWFDRDIVPNPRGAEFEDRSGQLRVITPNGKVMTINASAENGHGIFITYAAKFGQVVFNVLTGDAFVTHRKAEFREKPTTLYGLPSENYTAKFTSSDLIVRCQKTLTALLSGKDYPDGETVRRTVEILSAAYLSDEQDNRAIDVEKAALTKERIFPWA